MTLRSWARLGVVLVVALIFQVSVLDQIVILGAHPDVMILLPAAAGLIGGPSRGAVIGFCAGLVADLVVTLPFGLSALVFTLIGFALGLLSNIPAGRELTSAQIGACVGAAAVGTLAYALGAALIHQPDVLRQAAASAVFVVALGACVLSYPALVAMRFVLAGSAAPSFIPSSGSAAA